MVIIYFLDKCFSIYSRYVITGLLEDFLIDISVYALIRFSVVAAVCDFYACRCFDT